MARTERRLALLAILVAAGGVLLCSAAVLFAGVVGSPHDFSRTSLLTQYQTAPLTPQGVCSICHIPHNAQYGALWPRNLLSTYDNALKMNGGSGTSSDLPNYKRGVTVQCYDCHDWHQTGFPLIDAVPPYNGFARNHKPQNIAFGYQKTTTGADLDSTMKEDQPGGTEAGYYENSPPYLSNPQTYYGADSSPGSPFQRNLLANDNLTLARTGGHYFKSVDPNPGRVYKGDKLPCSDCHDPHAWNPAVGNRDWHAFFRPVKVSTLPRWTTVFGSSNPTASTYMANPILSGETSRNDAESRKLCIVCHATSDTASNRVTFNDVNSAYSSFVQVVAPPASIGEHNSSSSVACVSCHSHNSIGANCSQCHGFPPSSTANPAYPATAASTFVPVPNPGTADSHVRHYGGASGQARNGIYQFDCGVCHFGSALGIDSALQHHQNSRVSVVIQGVWTKAPNGSGPLGTYDNTNYYNPAFGAPPANTNTGQLDNTTNPTGWGTTTGPRYGSNTCWNVYCHSIGRSQASMALNDNTHYRQVAWNSGPQRCNDCHGRNVADNTSPAWGMPDYASGPAGSGTANSHGPHVVTNRYECTVCHAQTVTGTGANRAIVAGTPTRHVNGVRDVAFDGVNATGTYDNTVGLKTCVVSCHGNNPVRWGGPPQSCDTCHVRTGDVDDFGTGTAASMKNGVTAGIDNNEWNWSGHGKDAGNYDVSGNPPANLRVGISGSSTGTNKCAFCHDPALGHDNAANPFRLANNGVFGQGWNGACYVCHAASSIGNSAPGYAPAADNSGTYVAKTASQKVASNHYNTGGGSNARHTATYNGGAFCFDCHDPHGDRSSVPSGNIFMVGKRVSMRTDNAAGTGIPVGGNDNSNRPTATFTNNVNGSDYASTDNVAPYDGICETCHEAASGILHYTRTGRLDSTHFTSKCTTCHTHDGGFRGLGGPDVGQYFDRSIQAPSPSNFADNSSHPLNGLTAASSLRFSGTTNCLGCHYASGPARTSDECLMCHYENPDGSQGRHMNKVLELTSIAGNSLPTTQFTVTTIQQFDDWCLQCHNGATVSLGGVTASGRTVLSPSAFQSGRHRAQSPPVGCIYCHAPHGSGNARLVRINPANRASAGPTPREFSVFPGDNTGSYTGTYGATGSEAWPYRARVDNVAPNVFADAGDENTFCNKACHPAKNSATLSKEKILKRDGPTGLYTLTPVNLKTYTIEGSDYTRDNVTTRSSAHGHLNNEIITTDDMVNWFADPARGNVSGPARYKYPNSGNANPATFNNATSPLPFFPDFGDGTRDFTNGYLNLGPIRYRYTCSTCHNPHGTTDTLNNVPNGESYPDLRGKRTNTSTLCKECHK